MHIELISAVATAPGAGGAAMAAVTGDSLTIKNSRGAAQILAAWVDCQGGGYLQMIRPSGHDTTRDIRIRTVASDVKPLLPLGVPLMVSAQEAVGLTIAGSATAGDVEVACLLIGYKDLPGVEQRLLSWAQLKSRIEEVLTVDCTITAAGGGATYSGRELIGAESDLMKANTDYAIIGAVPSVECAAICVDGPDTGNVRIGLPGCDNDPQLTGGFFGLLSRAHDMALVPVINSGNRSSTYISVMQDENNTAVTLSLVLAKLKGGG